MYQYLFDYEAKYPNLISHESIGKTWQGRDILLFKVGNPWGGRVMFNGTIHGGERVGTEVYLHYVDWLFENREPGISDRILQLNYTLIVPIFNVDGFPTSRNNQNPTGTVNLNRNFPKSWRTDCTILGTPDPATGLCPSGQEKIGNYCYKTGCSCYWSDTPGSDTYRGTVPSSEPETQAMLNAFAKWKPKFVLDYHTWEGPYFARPSWRSGITTEDKAYHDTVAQKIRSLATQRGVRVYSYAQLGVCGSLADDGYATGRATAYLIEGLGVTECGGYVNPPYSMVTDIAFPGFLPLAIVFSQECEGLMPPVDLPLIGGIALAIADASLIGYYIYMKVAGKQ